MKRMFWICLLVLGLMLSWSIVIAGDFYVIPVKGQVTSWDKKIAGATRFKLVLDSAAALDRETGLVWEKSPLWTGNPSTSVMTWIPAIGHCYKRRVGGRKGWRLPAIEELASLVDTSVATSPKLPAGHPFTNVQSGFYWSSSTRAGDNNYAWSVGFGDGGVYGGGKSTTAFYVWCVRGGYGHDAY